MNNIEPAEGGVPDQSGNIRLHIAAATGGTTDIMVEAIGDRSKLEAKNDLSQTPLHIAASGGVIDSVVYLSWLGSDLEARDAKLNTPLICAAEKGYGSIVRYLLDKGAKIEARNSNGETALHLASAAGMRHIVEELCGRGAKVTRKTKSSRTPLHLAALSGPSAEEIIGLLISHKAEINASDDAGDTAVNLAAAKGDLDAVRALISRGADHNKRNAMKRTPLLSAAFGRHSNVVEYLLKTGARASAEERALVKRLLDSAAEAEHRS